MSRALLVGLLALHPLLFWWQLFEHFEQPKFLLLVAVALALAAAAAVRALEEKSGDGKAGGAAASMPARPPRFAGLPAADPLATAVLFFLASAAISSLAGLHPALSLRGAHAAWQGLLTFVCLSVLFFTARRHANERATVEAMHWAVVLAATGAALYGVLQSAGVDPAWREAEHLPARGSGPLGNPNFLGGYLAAALPIVSYQGLRSLQQGARLQTLACGAAALSCAMGLVASFSRGPWLAATAGVVVMAGGAWWIGERRGARAVALAVAGGAVALVAVAAGLGSLESILDYGVERVNRIFTPGREIRPALWLASFRVFLDHPLLGTGPDALFLAIDRHAPALVWELERESIASRAHNDFLQVAATQGALGLVALGLIGVGVAASVRRLLRGESGVDGRRADDGLLAITWLAVLAAGAVHLLFGFSVMAFASLQAVVLGLLSGRARGVELQAGAPLPRWLLPLCALAAGAVMAANRRSDASLAVPALQAGALLALAVLSSRRMSGSRPGDPVLEPAPPGDAASPRARLGIRVGVVAVALSLGFALVVIPFSAARLARRGQMDRVDGRPAEAAGYLRSAVALEATNATYWEVLALAYLEQARLRAEGREREALLRQALAAAEGARAAAPGSAFMAWRHANILGELAALPSAPVSADAVYDAFDRLLAGAPAQPRMASDGARIALALGDLGRAEQYAQRALVTAPDLGAPAAQLARVALGRGEQGEALRHLEAAASGRWLNDVLGEASALTWLAQERLAAGRPAGALDAASRATRLAPGLIEAWLVRGRSLERLAFEDGCREHWLEARASYRQALSLAPGDEAALEAYARTSRSRAGPRLPRCEEDEAG